MIFLQQETKPDSNDKNDKEPNDPFTEEEKPTRKDRVMRVGLLTTKTTSN